MDPRELLSLLTARVQRFHLAPGGIPVLTAEDIATALGMVKNQDAVLYARVKYCGQHDFAEDVALAIRRRFLWRAADENWKIPRHGFLLDLSRLLLTEAVDPNICLWCNGSGDGRHANGLVVGCDGCNGTGRRKMWDRDRADLVGVSAQSWSNVWGKRYRDMQCETVDKWDDLIFNAVRKRLR